MDTVANEVLRAHIDVEDEFGPDYSITIMPNGWARLRFPSMDPILQVVSAQVCSSGAFSNPVWTQIPLDQIETEHNLISPYGTTIPVAGTGPTSVLIPPGYVSWVNGRKGFHLQVGAILGYPNSGIDQSANAAATTIHVDDITGWVGARGTIYDPPRRETVLVTAATPDTTGAISGPGTLTLSAGLKYAHAVTTGNPDLPDQTILISTMPQALRQAGMYFAVHYGLIRGSSAAIMQAGRGQVVTAGVQTAQDWHALGQAEIKRWAQVL